VASTDIVIDMGSKKTVLFSGGRVVLEHPSVVTVDAETAEPIYFGDKALATVGRTPDSLTPVFPIQRGVIADYDVAEEMLKTYMAEAFGNRIVKPKVMITMPTGVTEMQHHSVSDVAESAGGRSATTIESPLASALAFGVDFSQPKGSMVIDIGYGTTDIATISMGGIAACDCLKIAGGDFDESIIKYVRKEHNILIGPATAEQIKMQIGTAIPHKFEVAVTAKGRHINSGLPTTFEITSNEVYDAISDQCMTILNGIRMVIEKTPPDIVADIMSNGIFLTGGGAQLNNFTKFLQNAIKTEIKLSDEPEYTAVKGAAMALKNPKLLENTDYLYRSLQELKVDLSD